MLQQFLMPFPSDPVPHRRSHAATGDDPLLLTLGDRLRAARAAQGLTQEELALVAGVGRELIINLENGQPGVALGKANRVIKALGLELRVQERAGC
jgi:y4mF family transcriptional regulator